MTEFGKGAGNKPTDKNSRSNLSDFYYGFSTPSPPAPLKNFIFWGSFSGGGGGEEEELLLVNSPILKVQLLVYQGFKYSHVIHRKPAFTIRSLLC